MADDRFDRFRSGLQIAIASAKPTREQEMRRFETTFPDVIDAVRKMNDAVMEAQPSSTMS